MNKHYAHHALPPSIQEVYDNAECLYTHNEVQAAMDHWAKAIHDRLADSNPLLLCVLIGGMVPTGHLLPRLDFPLEVDYIHATRYLGEMEGDAIQWKARPSTSLKGRTVLVVDDILDGGITLGEILKYCEAAQAKEVLSAVLVDKQHPRDPKGLQEADFTALTVEDRFVFGYGMDYKEYLRNVSGIYGVTDKKSLNGRIFGQQPLT